MLSANMEKVIDKDKDDPKKLAKDRDKCFETYKKLCYAFNDDTDRV